jgi:predicted Co/Zn/Cd cation transporter (cation efflux family)
MRNLRLVIQTNLMLIYALAIFGAVFNLFATIRGIEYNDTVVYFLMGVITGLSIFNLIAGRSRNAYDGAIELEQKENGVKTFTLGLDIDPDTIMKRKDLLFKVEGKVSEEIPNDNWS